MIRRPNSISVRLPAFAISHLIAASQCPLTSQTDAENCSVHSGLDQDVKSSDDDRKIVVYPRNESNLPVCSFYSPKINSGFDDQQGIIPKSGAEYSKFWRTAVIKKNV